MLQHLHCTHTFYAVAKQWQDVTLSKLTPNWFLHNIDSIWQRISTPVQAELFHQCRNSIFFSFNALMSCGTGKCTRGPTYSSYSLNMNKKFQHQYRLLFQCRNSLSSFLNAVMMYNIGKDSKGLICSLNIFLLFYQYEQRISTPGQATLLFQCRNSLSSFLNALILYNIGKDTKGLIRSLNIFLIFPQYEQRISTPVQLYCCSNVEIHSVPFSTPLCCTA